MLGLLVLLLPRGDLKLESCDLSLVVLGLDVDLSQPGSHTKLEREREGKVNLPARCNRVLLVRQICQYSLLGGLAQVLLGSVELGLEQVNLALEGFRVGGVGLVLLSRRLVLAQLALELVELSLGHGELVLQRSNLLVLGEQLLLKVLVLGCEIVSTLVGGVGLLAERVEFLLFEQRGMSSVFCISPCDYSHTVVVIRVGLECADAHLLDAVLQREN